MTDRDIMKLALEALQGVYWSSRSERHDEAITALNERLAQPERPADFYDQAFALVQRQGKLIAELEEMLRGKNDD